jgi:SAM-dependent methyltransferase
VFEKYLEENPVRSADDYLRAGDEAERLRRVSPLVEDNSVDVIVSNCVLNLVRPTDKRQLFEEMFRVLKVGGRCVISEIVSDEDCAGGDAERPGAVERLHQRGVSGGRVFEDVRERGVLRDAGD